MVSADDEVAGPVVLADYGVPNGLSRPTHAHGQRQERESGGGVRVTLEYGLVAAHPGVVVHVTRLGHPDGGVDEEVGLDLASRPQGELDVGAVHGVAGLERHHPLPSELVEAGTAAAPGTAGEPCSRSGRGG